MKNVFVENLHLQSMREIGVNTNKFIIVSRVNDAFIVCWIRIISS